MGVLGRRSNTPSTLPIVLAIGVKLSSTFAVAPEPGGQRNTLDILGASI